MEAVECIICKNPAMLLPKRGDREDFNCDQCRRFGISGTVIATEKFKNLSNQERNKLSSFIKAKNTNDSSFSLTSNEFNEFLSKI